MYNAGWKLRSLRELHAVAHRNLLLRVRIDRIRVIRRRRRGIRGRIQRAIVLWTVGRSPLIAGLASLPNLLPVLARQHRCSRLTGILLLLYWHRSPVLRN